VFPLWFWGGTTALTSGCNEVTASVTKSGRVPTHVAMRPIVGLGAILRALLATPRRRSSHNSRPSPPPRSKEPENNKKISARRPPVEFIVHGRRL